MKYYILEANYGKWYIIDIYTSCPDLEYGMARRYDFLHGSVVPRVLASYEELKDIIKRGDLYS